MTKKEYSINIYDTAYNFANKFMFLLITKPITLIFTKRKTILKFLGQPRHEKN